MYVVAYYDDDTDKVFIHRYYDLQWLITATPEAYQTMISQWIESGLNDGDTIRMSNHSMITYFK